MIPWKVHFGINTVLKFARPGGSSTTERILWVDETRETAVMIDVFLGTAREYRIPLRDLLCALQDGSAERISDPFAYLWLPDDQYSRARIAARDSRRKMIAPFVDAAPDLRHDLTKRRAIMRVICARDDGAKCGSKAFRYRLVRQYLQRGQMENALLSDRSNSGYTRERRALAPPKVKEGRSRNATIYEHKRAGFIFTEDQKAAILPTIVRQRANVENTGRAPTWCDVAQAVWEIHFPDHIELIKGKQVVIPKLSSQCPSIRQIRHLYLQNQDITTMLRRRSGEKQFNLRMRAKLGDQRDIAYGPMMVVQIDFTIADIFLLNSSRTRILGRPTIAMIRDTFSRVIVGFALAWRHESWHTATLAILNMVGDKVEFCRNLGIEITPEMWPSGLFETALSDNGPLIANLFEHFRKSLNLRFDNTASGRGDRKPVVEAGFKDLNTALIHRLEGAIQPAFDRRQAKEHIKRAKKSARYTLHDLTGLIAEYCIHYNNHRVIEGYPLSDDMIGTVAAIPIQLWDFGVRSRTGIPRQLPVDQARLHCLCKGTASIRSSGIYFEGKPYSCGQAERNGWFVRARNIGRWEIEVLYHPSNLEIIYLAAPDAGKTGSTGSLEPCHRIRTEGDIPNVSLRERRSLDREASILKRRESEASAQHAARYRAKVYLKDAEKPHILLAEATKTNMKELQHLEVLKDAAAVHKALYLSPSQQAKLEALKTATQPEDPTQVDFDMLRDLV